MLGAPMKISPAGTLLPSVTPHEDPELRRRHP